MKISGKVRVDHYVWKGYIETVGETMVDSQLVVKPDSKRVLVWEFDSPTGTTSITRKTHTFTYDYVHSYSYEAMDGSTCKVICFSRYEYKWAGREKRQEHIKLMSFDDWQSCFVDLYYEHKNDHRGKDLQRVAGATDFESVTHESAKTLGQFYLDNLA